jgi:MYXO-CTERM domain-containing protein
MARFSKVVRTLFTAKLTGITAALIVAGALFLASVPAAANGRFPRAQRLVQSSDTPDVLSLYGTYGLLVTHDGGQSWSHVCEAATGTYMGEDPLLEILPGTKLVARTETALVASQASWCDFRSIFGNGTDSIADITRDPAEPNAIVALTGNYDTTAGFSSRIVRTTDAGKTWSTPLDIPGANIARGLSLDLAPSASGRLYVTGLDATGKGVIVVSDDQGAHFTPHAITGADSSAAPYLAAISSKTQDTLFVRTDAYTEVDGIDTANDSLVISTDAGMTWTTVITRHSKLFGFALSPDEKTLLAGYGDPQLAATSVDPADAGLYAADLATLLGDLANGEAHFTKIFASSVTCLRWTPTALFACTLVGETGFEVGRAADANFTLATATPFSPVLLLSKVQPLPCGQGTSAFGCYTDPVNGFPGTCAAIGAPCGASVPPPGTVSGVYTGGGGTSSLGAAGMTAVGGAAEPANTGGTAAASGSGGTPVIGAAGLSAAAGASAGGTPPASPSGGPMASTSCGCRTGVNGGSSGAAAAFLSLLVARARRRRRKLA